MITFIPLYRLINSEFYQFIKIVVDKVEVAGPTALKVKTAQDPLAQKLPILLGALNNEKANEETKELRDLDLERDSAIIGLTMVIKGNTYHANPAKRKAAQLLELFLDSQGSKISRLNYAAETTVLSKIVAAFTNEAKYSDAIALLGLQDWVVDLDTANTAFDAKYQVRNTSISVNTNIPAFGVVKTDTIPLYVELAELIESRYKTAKADGLPTAPYQNLINELNTLIASYLVYTQSSKSKPKLGNPA